MATNKKITAITGATGAIGKAIARQMASHGGFEVIIIYRNENRAEELVEELKRTTGNEAIRYEIADLSLQASIQNLADKWQDPLHVLINNAAVTPVNREETAEGVELQWATNVLGYYWMIEEFTKILRDSAPARIVNVASYWAGELNLDDPEFKQRRYDNNSAYRQSKQANRMLSTAFAEKFAGTGVTVNACHPGDVNSFLSNNLGYGGHETPDQGAETPVWLATESSLHNMTGKYFEHRQEKDCRFSKDKASMEKLMHLCSSY